MPDSRPSPCMVLYTPVLSVANATFPHDYKTKRLAWASLHMEDDHSPLGGHLVDLADRHTSWTQYVELREANLSLETAVDMHDAGWRRASNLEYRAARADRLERRLGRPLQQLAERIDIEDWI